MNIPRARIVWIGLPVLVLVLLAVFWRWDWFIPIVESRAAAAIGRPVSIGHLHVALGRATTVTADDVVLANPPDWPKDDPPLAHIARLTVTANLWDYLTGKGLVIPLIALDKPAFYAAETQAGAANFRLSTGSGSSGPSPAIGDVRIADGSARVVIPKLKADVRAEIDTQDDQLRIAAKGTYAAQPITGKLIGGALLSLRDAEHPWPVDLTLANGPTHVALKGTVQDPLAFQGADVTLHINGPDLGLLEPLVGFPIPKTPAYDIAGKLDFGGLEKIRFQDFRGKLGNSDIAGTIEEQPGETATNGKSRPNVVMNLRSNRVDLVDLNGFIGGEPGHADAAAASPQQRQAVAQANANAKLLPDKKLSIPRLTWADIHLRYRGGHIVGRNMPLDDLSVTLDIVDGKITLHPISFGIGKGRLTANVALSPLANGNVHARIDLRMQNLDVARMMAATRTFEGAGTVSGVGAIDAQGNSLATLLANGNGEVKMAMAGGDLSAVLVDLTGLHFGNALLSALGVPNKTPVECFVGDLALQRGILDFNPMVLQTGEGITNIGGSIDLRSEQIDMALKTDARHFSIGSLPTRITISGTLKNPSIRPGGEIAARAGAAAGLGVLFAPLAILPTVQFGTSEQEDARCGALLQQARAGAGGKALPPPQQAEAK